DIRISRSRWEQRRLGKAASLLQDRNCAEVRAIAGALSTYGSLHLEIDQTLQFHTVFHRELADQIIDKSINREAHCLSFAQTSLLHVEYLFGADLADAGFMLRRVTGPAHRNRWIGVRPAAWINQQGVALGVVLAALEMLRYVDQTAISCAAFADA